MAQVNFNIPDELKAELDKLMGKVGAESKPEFMQKMIFALNNHIANNVDIDIDLSKYENVNKQTKEAVSDTFRHLLTVLDNNFSTTKQEAIYIESQKQALAEKEEAFKAELEAIKAKANEKLLEVEESHKQEVAELKVLNSEYSGKLEALQVKNNELNTELENVSLVADQVKSVISENQNLREQIKSNEESFKSQIKEITSNADILETKLKSEIEKYKSDMDSIKSKADQYEKESFKNSVKLEQVTKNLKESEKKNAKLEKELLEVRAELNKALGRLEAQSEKD